MKRVNLTVKKCDNKSCGFYIVSDSEGSQCPICNKGALRKDKKYDFRGYADQKTDDAFLGFKKKVRHGNNNRPKSTPNQES